MTHRQNTIRAELLALIESAQEPSLDELRDCVKKAWESAKFYVLVQNYMDTYHRGVPLERMDQEQLRDTLNFVLRCAYLLGPNRPNRMLNSKRDG